MKINPSTASSALSGIQNGMKKLNETSEKIAQNSGDTTENAVKLLEAERQVQASSKVLEVENNLQKMIIDTFA